MVAARMSGLEARDAVAEVDPLDEPELVHALERPVHARDPDACRRCARTRVVDLLRREAAVLLAEELDDAPPRAAAAAARIA